MRTFLIVLLVLLVLGFIIYRKVKSSVDKILIGKPQFVGADPLQQTDGNVFTNVDVTVTITNENDFSISVKNLYLELYYNGELAGKSTAPYPNFVIPKEGSITIKQNVTVYLVSSLQIASKIIAGQTVEFQYMISATLFGFFPLRLNDNFIYIR